MNVQIAKIVADYGVRCRWLVQLCDRLIIIAERPICERSECALSARGHKKNVAFPKLKAGSQTFERPFDGGPGISDIVVISRHRERHAVQQVQRYADYKVGLVR